MVLSTIVVPLSFKPGLDRLGVGEVNRNGGEGAGWWLGRCGRRVVPLSVSYHFAFS